MLCHSLAERGRTLSVSLFRTDAFVEESGKVFHTPVRDTTRTV